MLRSISTQRSEENRSGVPGKTVLMYEVRGFIVGSGRGQLLLFRWCRAASLVVDGIVDGRRHRQWTAASLVGNGLLGKEVFAGG